MKKLLQLCFLIGIVGMGKTFANEGHTQKDINKSKFAEHKVSGHLHALPEGTYKIKISSGTEIIEKVFVKTSGATPIFE